MPSADSGNPKTIAVVGVGLLLAAAAGLSLSVGLREGLPLPELVVGMMRPLFFTGIVVTVALVVPRARSRRAMVTIALWAAGLATTCQLSRSASLNALHVTAVERQGLRIGPDSIRHPGFGFALPSPGPAFHVDTALQRHEDSLESVHPQMAGWVFSAPGRGVVFVEVNILPKLDADRFRTATQALRKSESKDSTAKVVGDSTIWGAVGGEYRLAVRYPAGWLKARCLAKPDVTRPWIVCVETVTASPEELAFVRQGLVVNLNAL